MDGLFNGGDEREREKERERERERGADKKKAKRAAATLLLASSIKGFKVLDGCREREREMEPGERVCYTATELVKSLCLQQEICIIFRTKSYRNCNVACSIRVARVDEI